LYFKIELELKFSLDRGNGLSQRPYFRDTPSLKTNPSEMVFQFKLKLSAVLAVLNGVSGAYPT